MAQQQSKKTASLPSQKESYRYPSRFGSHSSMIDTLETPRLDDPTKVVIADEYGIYTTERRNLDTGMADPARYAESRLGKLFEKSAKKD
jgi:hypothetical protein